MCLLARHPAQTKPDAEDFVVNHGKPESVEAKETRNPFGIVGRRVGIVGKDPRELVTQTSWIFADLNSTSLRKLFLKDNHDWFMYSMVMSNVYNS